MLVINVIFVNTKPGEYRLYSLDWKPIYNSFQL